jgi:molecular chaperone DnaK (HSP70)
MVKSLRRSGVNNQKKVIFGIDLGTTYSCISYVDEHGKAIIIPNKEHNLTTPSIALFEGENIIVGDEAKNNALTNPDAVVEMVKRHMGEANWRFPYNGNEYTPEEISSYILRKLSIDAEEALNMPVKDVVITCPAYFGVLQREATVRAGEIAGLTVHEVINEPTAAAITYGLHNEQDQVVIVYDLGGGTFDITIIEIKGGNITVIATGGDHNLGGRNWDEAVVLYLAQQWQAGTGSSDDPADSMESLQDLWLKAEKAKWALTARDKTGIVVAHADHRVKTVLTRQKFDELTASYLDRTVLFTKMTMDEAKARGYKKFDKILLVGGSTKMPQIAERLTRQFHIPLRTFEPDEAVAKGAAIYGQKLLLNQHIRANAAKMTDKPAVVADRATSQPDAARKAQATAAKAFALEEKTVEKLVNTSITNVTSHSFGILVTIDHQTKRSREVIENLMLVNDPLPACRVHTYGTLEANQSIVELRVIENTEKTSIVELERDIHLEDLGKVVLPLPAGLPENSPIEVTFKIDQQGRLHVVGRELHSQAVVDAIFENRGGISKEEIQIAKSRVAKLVIL